MIKQTHKNLFTTVFVVCSLAGVTALSGCNSKVEPAATSSTPPAAAPSQAEAGPAPQAAPAPEVAAAEKSGETKPKEEPVAKHTRKASTGKHAASHSQAADEAIAEQKISTHACQSCGTITAINTVEQEGEGSGLGAIAGGVAGAVLGHQVGGGTGKDIATIAGAAGGAFAGHQIEKKMKKTVRYDITVKMENGEHRTVSEKEAPALAVGDKVKIVDGMLQRN